MDALLMEIVFLIKYMFRYAFITTTLSASTSFMPSKHTHPLLRGASQNMLSALLVRQNDTVPYALYWTIRFGVSSKDRRQFLRQYVQILDNKINLFHCSDFML